MADFVRLWAARGAVVEAVEDGIRDADSSRGSEVQCATLIQSLYRGSVARGGHAVKRDAVTNISRLARGHAARVTAESRREVERQRQAQALFNYCATMIQKQFRGFHSRRYQHDYYARAAYIEGVRTKSDALRQQLSQHRQDQLHAEAVKAEEAARKEFTTVTQNFHHLVSTASIPGVFNPPYAQSAEEVPSAFGIPMEAHLRVGVKSLLRTRGLRKTKDPPTYAGPRQSLRSQGVYGADVAAERQASRSAKLNQLDSRPFTGGGTARVLDPVANYKPGLSQGVPYQAPWQASKGVRDMLDTEEMKAKRVSEAPFHSTVSRGSIFEEVERARSRERQSRARRILGSR